MEGLKGLPLALDLPTVPGPDVLVRIERDDAVLQGPSRHHAAVDQDRPHRERVLVEKTRGRWSSGRTAGPARMDQQVRVPMRQEADRSRRVGLGQRASSGRSISSRPPRRGGAPAPDSRARPFGRRRRGMPAQAARVLPWRRPERAEIGANEVPRPSVLRCASPGRPSPRRARGGPRGDAPRCPDGGTRTRSTQMPACRRSRREAAELLDGLRTVGQCLAESVRASPACRRSGGRARHGAPRPAERRERPSRMASTRAATRCGSSSASGSPGSRGDPPARGSGNRAGTLRGASTGRRSPTGAYCVCEAADLLDRRLERQLRTLEEELAREQRPVERASGQDSRLAAQVAGGRRAARACGGRAARARRAGLRARRRSRAQSVARKRNTGAAEA